jgi:hypothetical protein
MADGRGLQCDLETDAAGRAGDEGDGGGHASEATPAPRDEC